MEDELGDLYFIIMEYKLNQMARNIIKNLTPFFNQIGKEILDLEIELPDCTLPDYIIKGDIPEIEICDYL